MERPCWEDDEDEDVPDPPGVGAVPVSCISFTPNRPYGGIIDPVPAVGMFVGTSMRVPLP